MACSSICLTIDIDWAHDALILDLLNFLVQRNIAATWFVTHDTPMLREIANRGHELGLHPNLNPLLTAGPGGRDAAKRLLDLQRLVPEARSIRCHSLVRSSRLSSQFARAGLTRESNVFLPFDQTGLVPCWRGPEGMLQVPVHWEDDVYMEGAVGNPLLGLQQDGLFVVDIHPIHFFLNCDTSRLYEDTRLLADQPAELTKARSGSQTGVRSVLDELVTIALKADIPFLKLSDLAT